MRGRNVSEVYGRVGLASHTLEVSQGEINGGHAGVHATASSDPNRTMDVKGCSQEVGLLGLSLS